MCGVGVVPSLPLIVMKSWKLLFGVGAACAACCAVPLVAWLATLLAGSTALFAGGLSALRACADEFLPVAALAAAIGAGGTGLWLWRRRAARRDAGCACPPAAPNDSTSPCCAGGSHAGQ